MQLVMFNHHFSRKLSTFVFLPEVHWLGKLLSEEGDGRSCTRKRNSKRQNLLGVEEKEYAYETIEELIDVMKVVPFEP